MNVCYEYVGIVAWWVGMGDEAQAAWVGAIGTVAAIGVTATFYAIDKISAISGRRTAAREEHRKRTAEITYRSRLMLPAIAQASETLSVIHEYLTTGDASRFFIVPTMVGGVEEVIEAAGDLSLYDDSFAQDLAGFIGYAKLFNQLLPLRAEGNDNLVHAVAKGAKVRTKEIERTVEELRTAADRCMQKIRAIAGG